MKQRFKRIAVRPQPKPYYPKQDNSVDWLRPILWFGLIGIFALLIVLGNLPR